MSDNYLVRFRRGWYENVGTAPDEIGYHDLVAAILIRSLKDYVGRELKQKERPMKEKYRQDAIRFFRSAYCDLMLPDDITGEMIMEHVDKHGFPVIDTLHVRREK